MQLIFESIEIAQRAALDVKMARTNLEWVAQVSLLRPVFLPQMDPGRNTQVSEARPGPPTQCLEVVSWIHFEREAIRLFPKRALRWLVREHPKLPVPALHRNPSLRQTAHVDPTGQSR